MSDCKTYRSQIEEAADAGGLSRETLGHLRTCRACADFWRQGVSLRRHLRELDRVEAPADFEFRLRARMAGRGGRGSFFGGFYRVRGFAPLAAAVCFLTISATLFFWHGRQTATPAAKDSSLANATSPAANGQSGSNVTTSSSATNSTTTNPPAAFTPATGPLTKEAGEKRSVARRAKQSETRIGMGAAERTLVADLGVARVVSRPPVKIPVGTSAEPLRVILRDETGAARVVPMRTVSFGSQEMLAREGVRQRTLAPANEGVW